MRHSGDASCEIFIELLAESNPFPIGLYLVKSDGRHLTNTSTHKFLNADFNNAFLLELNSLKATIEPNCYYTIVPSTLKKSQLGNFGLKIFCDRELELAAGPARIDYKESWSLGVKSVHSAEISVNQKLSFYGQEFNYSNRTL
jgi:hypothetical protein